MSLPLSSLLLLAILQGPPATAPPPADAERLGHALLEAAGAGEANRVGTLLAAGADPGAHGKFRVTALMRAAEQGDPTVVELLLAAGARADETSSFGETPLFHAVRGGSAQVVRRLLTAGADPNARAKFRRTPLLLAAETGRGEIVRLLLAAGAAPGEAMRGGTTPLLAAARGGHADAVEALLAAGADLDARDADGEDAVAAATASGHADLAARLAAARAERGLPPSAPSPPRERFASVADVPWDSWTYPLDGCPVVLRSGRTTAPPGPCAVTATEILIGDLAGGPEPEAMVVLHLLPETGRAASRVLFFALEAGRPLEIGRLPPASAGPALTRVRLADRVLELTFAAPAGSVERWRLGDDGELAAVP